MLIFHFSDLKVSHQSNSLIRPLLLGTNGGLNSGVLLYSTDLNDLGVRNLSSYLAVV